MKLRNSIVGSLGAVALLGLLGCSSDSATEVGKARQALSDGIVIAEVYGGADSNSATYSSEYVVLFNRGSDPVSLDGLYLQYASASASGTFGSLNHELSDSAVVPPGRYYLVAMGHGTAGASIDADEPEQSDINMSGTNGRVVLSTTVLDGCGGPSNCPAANIVDFVGYGSANDAEGASTDALSPTTSAKRNGGGCQETDDNAADFTVSATPDTTEGPRNSSTPVHVCGTSGGGGAGGSGNAGTVGGAGGTQAAGGAGTGDCTGTVDDLVITEIMYDPVTDENNEWVEVTNTGDSCVVAEGWVLDDANPTAKGASNLPGFTVEPGESVVFHSAPNTGFASQWSLSGVQLVPVTGWDGLNNGVSNSGVDGDQVGIWTSFADYDGDQIDHAHAAINVDYDTTGDWPVSNNSASITLVSLDADPSEGSSWVLSVVGENGATQDSDGSVGSPGIPPGASGPGVGGAGNGGDTSTGGSTSDTGGSTSPGGSAGDMGGSTSAGGTSSGGTSSSGGVNSGGAGTGGGSSKKKSDDDSGCSCRTTSGSGAPLRGALAMGLLGLFLLRRRRQQK